MAIVIEAELDLRTHALTDSVADARRLITELSSAIRSTQARLDDAQRLLDERARATLVQFREQAGSFLEHGGSRAHAELQERLDGYGLRLTAYRRMAVEDAQDIARETLAPWLRAAEQDALDWYRAVLQWFIQMLEPVWDRLTSEHRDLCGVPDVRALAQELSANTRFRMSNRISIPAPLSPLRRLADLFAGSSAKAHIDRETHRYLDWLLMLNVGQADNVLSEALHAARQALQVRLRNGLEETLTHSHRVMAEASRVRDDGAVAIAAELSRINRERAGLQAIREAIGSSQLVGTG